MADELLTALTSSGKVQGRKAISSRDDIEYYVFQAIPYAKPPLKDLRFKAPEPAESWSGIRDCTKEGSVSVALDMLAPTKLAATSSEDCLFINVYSTRAKSSQPVMVWVHGGGFSKGSGNTDIYGPDYLISEGVVLVTFNYRLGCLGFLSLENDECPGNFGLKDMKMALQWVQKNISNFGGDPNNVTIFGESAGAAAVHYLVLSQQTKGLFHKAIAQSGSAVSNWAVSTSPRKTAVALARILGCESNDDRELLEFFKTVPADKLVWHDSEICKITMPNEHCILLPFVPVVEPEGAESFITKHPEDIARSGHFSDVPFIQGATSLEALFLDIVRADVKSIQGIEKIKEMIPSQWALNRNSKTCEKIVQKIQEIYFQDNNPAGVYQLISTIHFYYGLSKSVNYLTHLQHRKSPSYVYQFSFDGDKAVFKKLTKSTLKGASHGDELSYLFRWSGVFDTPLNRGTREYKAVEDITKLWTNFAKYGNPTPDTGLWKPVTKDNNVYLDIDDELTLKHDMQGEHVSLLVELERLATGEWTGQQ